MTQYHSPTSNTAEFSQTIKWFTAKLWDWPCYSRLHHHQHVYICMYIMKQVSLDSFWTKVRIYLNLSTMTTSKFMMEVEGLNKKLSLHYHNSQNKDSSLMSACFILRIIPAGWKAGLENVEYREERWLLLPVVPCHGSLLSCMLTEDRTLFALHATKSSWIYRAQDPWDADPTKNLDC